MKNLILFFMILGLVSCNYSSQKNNFEKIKIDEVLKILIKKDFYDTNSVEFNKEETAKFINYINLSGKLELLKAQPKYWIVVKFKNGNERNFKLLGNYIGEFNDYKNCNEVNYFKNIYYTGLKIESK